MKKLFVPFEIACLLKNKNFNKKCVAYYTTNFITSTLKYVNSKTDGKLMFCRNNKFPPLYDQNISAPIHQQVIDWLKEKHNLYIIEQIDMTCEPKYCYEIYKYEDFGNWTLVSKRPDMFLYSNSINNLDSAIKEALTLI